MVQPSEARSLALALPRVEEAEAFGLPSFQVFGQVFAVLDEPSATATLRTSPAMQEALLHVNPVAFSLDPVVPGGGWIRVHLDHMTPDLLADLTVEAWKHAAPEELAEMWEQAEEEIAEELELDDELDEADLQEGPEVVGEAAGVGLASGEPASGDPADGDGGGTDPTRNGEDPAAGGGSA